MNTGGRRRLGRGSTTLHRRAGTAGLVLFLAATLAACGTEPPVEVTVPGGGPDVEVAETPEPPEAETDRTSVV